MEKLIWTEKQIQWAEDIKKQKNISGNLALSGLTMPEIENHYADNPDRLARIKENFTGYEYITSITNVNFWIDYRNLTGLELLNTLRTGGLQIDGFNSTKRAYLKNGRIIIK